MTKIRFIAIALLLLLVCTSLDAQTRKNTRKTRAKTTKVQTKKVVEKKDTVALAPKKEEPKYKSLNDPMVVRYLRGGFAKEKKLYLVTNAEYETLNLKQKQEVLNKVVKEFVDYVTAGPESSFVADLKSHYKEGKDFEVIGSTKEYDIIQPLC